MFLALTRGLIAAPVLPQRDDGVFDTFFWHKFCSDIPSGCLVFTDGSLLDGRMQKGVQSLGWAFVIITRSGDLVAAAFGVPPKWVDTIQCAELWAVQMALSHVAFPENCTQIATQFVKGSAVVPCGHNPRKEGMPECGR